MTPSDLPDRARRSLPSLPAQGEDGWTHVREVLHLPTREHRVYYLRATQEGNWSTRQLRAAIQADAFGHETRPPRLRLRGIDCPELATRAGRNARAFVEECLSRVGFVSTHRTDTYGRYLADLRYRPGEVDPNVVARRGSYLNRELLDRHLARRYLK